MKVMEEAPVLGEGLSQKYKKWDIVDQQVKLEEEREEAAATDFSKEAQVKEMFGCARDHSKEIDIYNKSNPEKMQRIN